MPWEKRFDEDEALDAAMQLFWERGYQGVSMSDLVTALGVSRSSLYDTFGQKDELFRCALRRYDRVHREEWLADLTARLDPVDSIAAGVCRGRRCSCPATPIRVPARQHDARHSERGG